MSTITRFPHYHQAENVVTNHVMVMLRTLYDASPKLLEALLRSLCEQDVIIGPVFSQQVSGTHSVPDGLILQKPLSVFIETKLGSKMNAEQLNRHCHTIAQRVSKRPGSFLIALTAGAVDQKIPPEVIAVGQEHDITIVSATFRDLIEAVDGLEIADLGLKEIAREFADFIYAQGLVPRREQFLAAMLTGTTWRDNVSHGIYYESVDRSPKHRRAAFLGLYHNKRISHVGKITAVVPAIRDSNGEIAFENPEIGTIDVAMREAVGAAMVAALKYYPNLADSMHRYYRVDAFWPTDLVKISPSGMMGHRYLDIEAITGKPLPVKADGSLAAKALERKTFK
jgi:hypothetical protein